MATTNARLTPVTPDPVAGLAMRQSLWQEQAQATVYARLAEGCALREALRCAAGPLKAARRSRLLHALAELEASPARPGLTRALSTRPASAHLSSATHAVPPLT
jgi:hypothetical protein